jgi:putative FmdB family regulatory protein
MPIYVYRCENCGVQFDRQQKYTDKPLTQCPECNKKSLRKVIAPVGIVFKGKGFYATDNRSPSGQSFAANKNNENKESSSKNNENKDSGSAKTTESAEKTIEKASKPAE